MRRRKKSRAIKHGLAAKEERQDVQETQPAYNQQYQGRNTTGQYAGTQSSAPQHGAPTRVQPAYAGQDVGQTNGRNMTGQHFEKAGNQYDPPQGAKPTHTGLLSGQTTEQYPGKATGGYNAPSGVPYTKY